MRRLLLSASIVLLVAACADNPAAISEDLSGPHFAKLELDRGSPISLTGRTTFAAYFSVTNEWFLNPDVIYCPVEADLSFGDGHDVVLTTTEGGGCAGRELTWQGRLTPGGALKLNMQADQAPLVEEHTGCTLSGTFPVYHGHFDGESLHASGHFHGHCDGGTVWGPLFGFPDDPGPVHVTFGIELTRTD